MPGLFSKLFSCLANPGLQGWKAIDNRDGTLTPVVSPPTVSVTLLTLVSAVATAGVNLGMAAHKHTLQVVVTGAPATGQIQLEGTLDDATSSGATWAILSGSQLCTTTTTFHVVDRPVTGIRANLTALTGGTNPTVACKYLGVQ